MAANFTYLLIDIGALIVPLIFSFHSKIKFNKQWNAFWKGNLIITVLFLIWDICFTKAGVWGFNERYTLGVNFFNLPLEEVLFFFCIPYSSVFTYHCFQLFFPKLKTYSFGLISAILIIGLTVFGFVNFSKLYTSVTFLALALILIDIVFFRNEKWLSTFYFMYLVILLPFFIVNGVLTGTGLDEPVVWYNNSENLGIRLLTIPLEDMFYGMLLLLMNVLAFESFKKRNAKKENINISI